MVGPCDEQRRKQTTQHQDGHRTTTEKTQEGQEEQEGKEREKGKERQERQKEEERQKTIESKRIAGLCHSCFGRRLLLLKKTKSKRRPRSFGTMHGQLWQSLCQWAQNRCH